MGNKKAIDLSHGDPEKEEIIPLPPPVVKIVKCGICNRSWTNAKGDDHAINSIKSHATKHRENLQFRCNRCTSPQKDAAAKEAHMANCPWKGRN